MKFPKALILVVTVVLIFGVSSVQAYLPGEFPAKEPWTEDIVDSVASGSVGEYASIAHHPVSGRIYISYYDATAQDLRLTYQVEKFSGNCGPDNSWYCGVVDETGDVGKYSSIDIAYVERVPPAPSYSLIGISYFDETNGALKYAQLKTNLKGWTYQVVEDSLDDSIITGLYTSMRFSPTFEPRIAYHKNINDGEQFGSVNYAAYVGWGDGNCGPDNNWYCMEVDGRSNDPNYGSYTSLALKDDGSPRIAYYDSLGHNLYFAKYIGIDKGNCGTNDSWSCTLVDDSGISVVGKFSTIEVLDSARDMVGIAYYDETNGTLRYAEQVSGGGNCTSSNFNCLNVDTIGAGIHQLGLSVAIDKQGHPIIAYLDASNEFVATKLKIARPALAYDQEVGNCGEIPAGAIGPVWTCSVLDDGYMDVIHEAAFVDVGIAQSGLASVAYFQWDSYNLEGQLKVAKQHFQISVPLIIVRSSY